MAFDIIVFTQDELDNALSSGIRSIGLCDNTFTLPPVDNICYTAIGVASAEINLTQSEFNSMNICCKGLMPVFTTKECTTPLIPLSYPQSQSSNISSYATSYFASYKIETSFSVSYSTSFRMYSSFPLGSDEYILVNGYGINLI